MRTDTIMLTGVPRSGTTLTCYLLNKISNTVALAEPMPVESFSQTLTRNAILKVIEQFAEKQRTSLLNQRVAVSKQVEGKIMDNFLTAKRDLNGLRSTISTQGVVSFDKPLKHDFRLIIKHPAAFTALLPELAKRFLCYAIIRNPLSVLASWNSASMPVNEGHAPVAEQIDSQLKETLSTLQNRFDRQIFLLAWYFRQYQQFIGPDCILRYEDIIESRGKVLAAIVPAAGSLNESLESKNLNKVYDWEGISTLAKRLLDSYGPYWDFYSRDDVSGLMK